MNRFEIDQPYNLLTADVFKPVYHKNKVIRIIIHEWVQGDENEVKMAFEKEEIDALIDGLSSLKDEL